MNFKILFILFITYSIIGWILEMLVTFYSDKEFVNRGFLIGPYCPIYGVSSISMILLLNNIKSPLLLFVSCILICSIFEYLTSYLMEKIFHARWWDYSQQRFNINGRICLKNCLLFGILGYLLIKYINVFFLNIYSSLNITVLNIIFYILITIFIIDFIISFNVIMKIKKSIKYINLDNTKEITEKVKKTLSNNILIRRIFNAFPKLSIKEKIKKLKSKVMVK